MVNGGQMIYCR